jgi:hypothetical protein
MTETTTIQKRSPRPGVNRMTPAVLSGGRREASV